MNELYYFHSIRNTNIQMLNLFNELRVAKYNPDGSIAKTIKVPLKMMPKEKFTYWLQHQKNFEKRLPMMGMSLTSITYSTDRVVNNNMPISYKIDDAWLKHLNPVPYDINYRLSIASQYMVEMDQILEQILPFFNPNVVVRVSLPEFNNQYDVNVLLSGISQETTPDIPQDDYRMVQWGLDFTAQGYLFQPVRDAGIIKKIIERFYNNKDSFAAMQGMDPNMTDSMPLSANHDLDAETTYIEGVLINNTPEILKYETYEGN